MPAVATLVSVEDYLQNCGKPSREYLDGVLRQKSMPTTLHALLQFLLVSLLRAQGVKSLAEVTVRMSPTRFLIPDVIAHDRMEYPWPTEPVTLCVEILSPTDRLSEAFSKCEEYHGWGVPYCWVIDPVKQTFWEYHRQSDPVAVNAVAQLRAGTLVVSIQELQAALAAANE